MNNKIRVVCILLIAVCLKTNAATYTDFTAFNNAVNSLGLTVNTDNFAPYALGPITNGQSLGQFNYNFDTTLTQPAIVSNGIGGQALGASPYDVFTGGESINLTFTGTPALQAFGVEISYAPNFEDLPANLYQLSILDGTNPGNLGNSLGLTGDGGSFFLGFIGLSGDPFTELSVFSTQPLDTDGNPYLTPAYQINQLFFAEQTSNNTVPEPSTFYLLIAGGFIFCSRRTVQSILSGVKS